MTGKPQDELRVVGDRIEVLMGELAAASPAVQGKAEELVRLLMQLYGAGLDRILTVVDDAGQAAAGPIFASLAADDLVASLMILHDLHPLDLETRVARALDHVRPYLGSHGGDVKLLSVEEGVVLLRLEGSCQGCPSSTVTMKLAIEKAIEEAAPEILRIAVEGETQEATPVDPSAPIQIGKSKGINGSRWIPVEMPEIGPGGLAVVDVSGVRVIVCKPGDDWYAYRDTCPACGAPLATGALHDGLLSCAACARRYDVRRAGSAADNQSPPLQPLPLLDERGTLKIAIPGVASVSPPPSPSSLSLSPAAP
ncbi:MAG TPA: NifU family protein [Thermoanaerobaculia bacterium]|jgi:Fe-S cluster biogenesis protein NfuA/nitrite reductase/ring-hydroxylating ferredoxin subunit|nr:NifU family protein [Thermoanaerobaculia bacterium]